MRKIYVGVSIALLVCLMSGCLDDTRPTVTYTEPTTQSAVISNDGSLSTPSVSASPDSSNQVITSAFQPPDDMMWISPAKVNISNLYAGARAEWEMTLHNGNDYKTRFKVVVRDPDNVSDGYTMVNGTQKSWIVVADQTPVLAPRETRKILVSVDVPVNAKISSKAWEFWISAMDDQQQGQVITELCSRWQVKMR